MRLTSSTQPATLPMLYGTSWWDSASVVRNQPKPVSIRSLPKRSLGRLCHAHAPTATGTTTISARAAAAAADAVVANVIAAEVPASASPATTAAAVNGDGGRFSEESTT